MGHAVGREGIDDAADGSGGPAARHVTDQDVHAQSREKKRGQHRHIVRGDLAKAQEDGQRQEDVGPGGLGGIIVVAIGMKNLGVERAGRAQVDDRVSEPGEPAQVVIVVLGRPQHRAVEARDQRPGQGQGEYSKEEQGSRVLPPFPVTIHLNYPAAESGCSWLAV